MLRTRYHLSLTVLVPLILGGLAVLGALTGLWLAGEERLWRSLSNAQLALLLGATFLGAFLPGVLLLRWLLAPVQRFVSLTSEMEILPRPPDAGPPGASRSPRAPRSVVDSDPAALEQVFHQVREALSRLDAKSLFPEVIGQSRLMREVLNQALKVAPTDATVLLCGESGTGKELIAGGIHAHSRRSSGPLVAVNCAAIPESLLESELFGHEKGAFTGASQQRKGRFEQAHGGTLFLDEIGDMPLETQATILRVLETGQVERVGGARTVTVDVRIVAATNQNLPEMIRQGRFREDLYHRLNVFPIQLPPLRRRREDIPLLAAHFAERFRPGCEIRPWALQRLMSAPWPGNVRELRNAIERAAVLAGDGSIGAEHLPPEWGEGPVLADALADAELRSNGADPDAGSDVPTSPGLDDRLVALEKAMILEALARTGGVQVQAARLLGIKERSLWHRIKKYGIDVSSLKN